MFGLANCAGLRCRVGGGWPRPSGAPCGEPCDTRSTRGGASEAPTPDCPRPSPWGMGGERAPPALDRRATRRARGPRPSPAHPGNAATSARQLAAGSEGAPSGSSSLLSRRQRSMTSDARSRNHACIHSGRSKKASGGCPVAADRAPADEPAGVDEADVVENPAGRGEARRDGTERFQRRQRLGHAAQAERVGPRTRGGRQRLQKRPQGDAGEDRVVDDRERRRVSTPAELLGRAGRRSGSPPRSRRARPPRGSASTRRMRGKPAGSRVELAGHPLAGAADADGERERRVAPRARAVPRSARAASAR